MMNISEEIVSLESIYDVKETIDRLENAFRAKHITIYGRINQQTEAHKVGLELNPTELLIFGNPALGIPLIANQPLCAIDLPLKVLAWENNEGQVWLSYYRFSYFQSRFMLPAELVDKVSQVEKLIVVTVTTRDP
jgi:uncharacterized protein (DUF302 family)